MKITSNTQGIFERMLSGQVFDNPLTFITEFYQNCQRANAKNLHITINEDELKFSDDGCGLKDPKHILTFNESSWESTTEGFGLGFWSILSIPNIEYVEIKSRKYIIKIDIERAQKDLEVDVIKTNDYHRGFEVLIKSNYIKSNSDDLINKIKNEGEIIPINIYLNDNLIDKIDIFKNVTGIFTKEFNTKYFKAKLAIQKTFYPEPTAYYEYRVVCPIYNYPYVTGVIDLKKNAVDFKAPDRTSIIYNSKRALMLECLEKCIKELYKEFIKTNSSEKDLHSYADGILKYLSPSEFEKILFIEDIKIKKPFTLTPKIEFKQDYIETLNYINSITPNGDWSVKTANTSTEIDIIDISNLERVDLQLISKEELEHNDEIIIGDTILKKNTTNLRNLDIRNDSSTDDSSTECTINLLTKDYSQIEDDRACESYEPIKKKSSIKKFTIKDLIKSNKNLIWVSSNEVSEFSDAISLAEYNGLIVFTAPNQLYETYLTDFNIPHISNLDSSICSKYIFKNLNCKTEKERVFLNLLNHITNYYNISKNTFKIGEIECDRKIEFNGKTLLNKKIRNKKDDIQIYAVCSGNEIILERKSLDLKSFKLSNDRLLKPGKHEFMAIAYNLNTIAHELAHLLYNTTDNTKEHTRMELLISSEILCIYKKLL